MLKKLIILTSVFTITQVFAVDVLIKAGANNSWFANEGGTSETKPAAGIGVQFPLDEARKVKLGVDVLYVAENMILEDRSLPYSTFSFKDCEVYTSDLHLYYHYLQLPVYLNLVVFQQHNLMAAFTFGLGLKFNIGSDSSTENYNFDIERCDYDYERVMTDGLPWHPAEVIIGASIAYKSLGTELVYHYTLGKTESLYGLKIQDHIHSIRLMIVWRLNKLFNQK